MKKILIVDDTKMWLHFHIELLTQFYGNGIEIVTCESGKEALRVLHDNIDNPFDLILTDMQMECDYVPLQAGEWLVKNTKMIYEYKNVPIIIISAMPDIEQTAKKLNVECICKQKLVNNKLLLKYTIEKLIAI